MVKIFAKNVLYALFTALRDLGKVLIFLVSP